ncbi:MAG: phage head morphogenesis protein [Paludibacteraceae bacterium]|nr:phage head morphogenesis protein [Paludibacteraceae bacterium]
MTADKWTDKELVRLEKRITRIYKESAQELKKQSADYFATYAERWKEEYKAYQKGKYTEDQFKAWELSQLGRGAHWDDLADQMAERMVDTAKMAQDITNGILPKVYTKNSNEIAKIAQDSAIEQGITGIRFDLVDEYAVARLMKGSSEVRPYKPVALDLPLVDRYSRNKLNNALLQGVLQGDSIDKLANRFMDAGIGERWKAIRSARTAVTGAQSAGKQDRYTDLASKGCEMTKIWVATDDDRTRPEHAEADGQEVAYDEPFDVGGEELMYPADPNGSGWNVYNCRCTTKAGKIKFKSRFENMESDTYQRLNSISDIIYERIGIYEKTNGNLRERIEKFKSRLSDANKYEKILNSVFFTNYDDTGCEYDPITKRININLNEINAFTLFHEAIHVFDDNQIYIIPKPERKIKRYNSLSDYILGELYTADAKKKDINIIDSILGTNNAFAEKELDRFNCKNKFFELCTNNGIALYDSDIMFLSDFVSSYTQDSNCGSMLFGGHRRDYLKNENYRMYEILASYGILKSLGRYDLLAIEKMLLPNLYKIIEKEWDKLW